MSSNLKARIEQLEQRRQQQREQLEERYSLFGFRLADGRIVPLSFENGGPGEDAGLLFDPKRVRTAIDFGPCDDEGIEVSPP